MLNEVYEGGYNYIHSATPGPVGLAALGIARILNLPISGTYHTALPQYAAYLTEDDSIEQLVWRYTLWYYDQMGTVYVPSRKTGDELKARGLDSRKIRTYPRGVDIVRFHPSKRNGYFRENYDVDQVTRLLYVGRVSKEKNLPLLVEVFKEVCRESKDVHLVVVGDGPYLAAMKEETAGLPCTFTGYRHGEELVEIYASCDIFIFPSTTDTFGNVILEAQASGLPVIVTDEGGPIENMIAGQTGLLVPGNDSKNLVRAIRELVGDPKRRARMAEKARSYAETRSFRQAFQEHWNMYLNDYRQPQGSGSSAGAIS